VVKDQVQMKQKRDEESQEKAHRKKIGVGKECSFSQGHPERRKM